MRQVRAVVVLVPAAVPGTTEQLQELLQQQQQQRQSENFQRVVFCLLSIRVESEGSVAASPPVVRSTQPYTPGANFQKAAVIFFSAPVSNFADANGRTSDQSKMMLACR